MKVIDEKILKELTEQIRQFHPKAENYNVGQIIRIGDGIATIYGLTQSRMGEVLEFPGRIAGAVLNLKKEETGAIVLGDYSSLKEGDQVTATGKILNIKVSDSLFGRVLNPLGVPIDARGLIKYGNETKEMPLEKIAPGVIAREPVNTPLLTGIKAIDAMTAIGRGQRELIIGDRNTGKTAIAVDTIINQSKENKKKSGKRVICVYVAIGQRQSKVAQVVDKLEETGAMEQTIVVAANASDPVALQYIAPYAGCAIGEYFMEKGEDALIIYDDLTKHAWAYRQISLILRRPSGREAYPGDIFYLHSRLLERSCKLNKNLGGGSLTALPIIETQEQDISAYIPTNVISITDGQIYLEPDLFHQGIRPAINVGLSVSRVGGAAQLKMIKQIAGNLRLDLSQYNELAAFAQFGSDMDPITKSRIVRGQRVIEILKQPQYQTLSVEEEALEIWFVTKGYLDNIPLETCSQKSSQFVRLALDKIPEIRHTVYSDKGLTPELEAKMEKIAKEFIK